jgi:uncharacterized cupredoxin-like copper-binding protein
MHLPSLQRVPAARLGLAALAGAAALSLAACDAGAPGATPPITPGTSAQPREVNIVARDYAYVPSTVDLHPGETVLIHLINGGLVVHEAVLGDMNAQLAWENAEAPFADAPPGPTPLVPGPSGFEGTRIVVNSGQRLDVMWTVPEDAAQAVSGWFVGCHIPGHWQKGMVVPVRFVDAAGKPIASVPPASGLPGQSVDPAAPSVSPGG